MHFLITGGAGFIGCHLTRRLLSQGHTAVLLDALTPPADYKLENLAALRRLPGFSFLPGDVRDPSSCKAGAKGADGVFHLAALAGVRASLGEPERYEDVNIRGTAALLSALARETPLPVVFASSSSVYGDSENVETALPRPLSPYASTKLTGEHLLCLYSASHKVGAMALRLFSVYGPGMRPDLAMRKFAAALCAKEPIELYGNCKRDYTHVSDVVSALCTAMEFARQNPRFQVFNAGRGCAVETKALLALLEKHLGPAVAVRDLGPQKGDARSTCANIEKARRMLGYSPRVDIQRGAYDFVRWFCPRRAGGPEGLSR